MAIFDTFSQTNVPYFDSSLGNHYPYTLENSCEMILGSFQLKWLTKFENISQNLEKQDFWSKWPFLGHFLGNNRSNIDVSFKNSI